VCIVLGYKLKALKYDSTSDTIVVWDCALVFGIFCPVENIV